MKRKPAYPTKKPKYFSSPYIHTLAEAVAFAKTNHLALEDVLFEFDEWDLSVYAQREETDEEFQARVEVYQNDLAEWEAWAAEHTEEIAQWEYEKAHAAELKAERALTREKRRAAKEVERLEKALRKAKKALSK